MEANVNAIDGIRFCGCIFDQEGKKIVLYYVGDMEPGQLVRLLKERVPRYMVPSVVRSCRQMPFTANGKIDRKKLQEWYKGEKKHGRD